MTKPELLFEQKRWMSQDLKTGARCTAILAEGVFKSVKPVAIELWKSKVHEYQNRDRKSIATIREKLGLAA